MATAHTSTSVHVTQLEADLLKKIYNSDYHDGAEPIGNPVWLHIDSKSEGGVLTSLQTKGLVQTQVEKKKSDSTVWILPEAKVVIDGLLANNWNVLSTSNHNSTSKTKSNMATADNTPAAKGIFNRTDAGTKAHAQTMSKPEFVKHYTEKTAITAEKAGEAWHDLRKGAKAVVPAATGAKAAPAGKVAKDPAAAPKPGKAAKDDKVQKKADEKAAKLKEKEEADQKKAEEKQAAKEARDKEKADKKAAKDAEKAAKAKETDEEKAKRTAAAKEEKDKAKAEKKAERDKAKEEAKAEKAKLKAVDDASKAEEKAKAKEEAAKLKAEQKELSKVEKAKAKEEAKAATEEAKKALAIQKDEAKKARAEQKAKEKEERTKKREEEKEAKRLQREADRANRTPRVKERAPLTAEQQAILDSSDAKSEKMRRLFAEHNMSVADIAVHTGSHYSFTYGVIERYKTDQELEKQNAAKQAANPTPAPAPAAADEEAAG